VERKASKEANPIAIERGLVRKHIGSAIGGAALAVVGVVGVLLRGTEFIDHVTVVNYLGFLMAVVTGASGTTIGWESYKEVEAAEKRLADLTGVRRR